MIPTPNQFFEIEQRKQDALYKNQPNIQYASVTNIQNNKPIIRFVGSETASEKEYIVLNNYIPQIGDRVILLNNIILGGWTP